MSALHFTKRPPLETVSAVSIVQAAIDRAEQVKDLNAFIFMNKDAALTAARKVDAGEISGSLAGLSIAVKDNIQRHAAIRWNPAAALRGERLGIPAT